MLENLPRISIIIPSFNQGKYIEEAIQSVLQQDYPELELVVIDGGSRDNSLQILQRYRTDLAYWVSEPDRGQSHAINKGFKHCTGEIITFLSSDDKYLPGTFSDLQSLWPQIKHNGAVVGAFQFMDEASHIQEAVIAPQLKKPAPLDLTLGPPGVYRLHQVATFYLREALDQVGRYVQEDLQYVMDRELLYRVCRSFPIYLRERTYGIFRKHQRSKSSQKIVSFHNEFAQLYLDSISGDSNKDRLRRRMARYRKASGYLKYANATGEPMRVVVALLKSAVLYPALLSRYSYLNAWRNLALRK